PVFGLLLLNDGRIIVETEERTPTSVGRKLVRLSQDGSIDPTFQPAFNFSLYSLAARPDGRLIGATGNNKLIQLNVDGSIDPSFQANRSLFSEEDDFVQSILVDPDGGVLVEHYGGWGLDAGVTTILRLENNGAVDQTFSPIKIERGYGASVMTWQNES